MRVLSAAICCLIAFPAAAADCADQTQLGLHKCADAAFQKADRALNDAYRDVVGRLGGDRRKKDLFAAAERDWIAFRDAECKFAVSSTEGGSIHPMEYLMCLEKETLERTKAIEAYLHCGEGDPGCPVPPP